MEVKRSELAAHLRSAHSRPISQFKCAVCGFQTEEEKGYGRCHSTVENAGVDPTVEIRVGQLFFKLCLLCASKTFKNLHIAGRHTVTEGKGRSSTVPRHVGPYFKVICNLALKKTFQNSSIFVQMP